MQNPKITAERSRLMTRADANEIASPAFARFALNPVLGLQEAMNRWLYPALMRSQRGIQLEGRVIVKRWPLLDIDRGAIVRIGNNVTLNSSNRGYHINMHSPVKLFAEGKGTQIVIGADTRIHGTCLHACERIQIGEKCLIAANTQIFDSSGHHLSFEHVDDRLNTKGTTKPVIIEDCVWIGANSIILPGVRIGRGSVVAAGSVVVKDVPPMCLAGGNPAQIIKTFPD